jgi:hypothetical protein
MSSCSVVSFAGGPMKNVSSALPFMRGCGACISIHLALRLDGPSQACGTPTGTTPQAPGRSA